MLRRIILYYEYIIASLNAIGTIGIVGLMLLINTDIFSRGAFNSPIAGVPEIVSYSIVGIVFLQLAHTLRMGGLTRSELLLGKLEKNAPIGYRVLIFVFNLIPAFLLTYALIRFWPSIVNAYAYPGRHFKGSPGFFVIPNWPLYIIIAIGLAATALQFAGNAVAAVFSADLPESPPTEEEDTGPHEVLK